MFFHLTALFAACILAHEHLMLLLFFAHLTDMNFVQYLLTKERHVHDKFTDVVLEQFSVTY